MPELKRMSARFDTQWMDDGARTSRFAPFFANSGFFYLRNNYKTRQFWDAFTLAGGLMKYWRSQQQVSGSIQVPSDHTHDLRDLYIVYTMTHMTCDLYIVYTITHMTCDPYIVYTITHMTCDPYIVYTITHMTCDLYIVYTITHMTCDLYIVYTITHMTCDLYIVYTITHMTCDLYIVYTSITNC
jgi:hypothetical protein